MLQYLWLQGVKTSEIYGRMAVQYGNDWTSQRKVYEWVQGFRGHMTDADDVHPGQSLSVMYWG